MFGATELFGHDVPAPGIAIAVIALMVGFFIVSRNDPRTGAESVGRGQMHRCKRCGRDFQPERVELLKNGDVHHFIDERCPGCGWDLEWGDPRKRPGGSSGTW